MRSTERLTVTANAENTATFPGGKCPVLPMPASAHGKHVDVEKKRGNERDSVADAETLYHMSLSKPMTNKLHVYKLRCTLIVCNMYVIFNKRR